MTQLLNRAALAGMVGDPRSPYWVRWAATIVYGPDLGKGQQIPMNRGRPATPTRPSLAHDEQRFCSLPLQRIISKRSRGDAEALPFTEIASLS
jgi:hypothetical protein